MPAVTTASASRRIDLAIALLVGTATAVHLALLPWNLGAADESFFLYEARRIREGEVMYRDFFQFVAPGAWYFMALLYSIFGTNMATARISSAIFHGAAAALLFASCRRMDARRELALLAPIAYVALCPLVWPYASAHWYGTLLVVLLLFMALGGGFATSARASFVLGAVAGVLILVQQQKGVIQAAGIGVLFIADALARRLLGAPARAGFIAQVFAFGAGVLAVVGPALLAMVAAAGWRPVYEDLVIFPIYEYPGRAPSTRWGTVGILPRQFAPYTWPRFLRFLPLVAVPVVLRLIAGLIAGRRARRSGAAIEYAPVGRQAAMLAFLLAGAASVLYNPDFIHLAFIAPIGMVALAENAGWLIRALRPRWLAAAAAAAAALVAAVPLGQQITANAKRMHATYPYRHQTAFGRVDFAEKWEPVFVDELRKALDRTASRELFGYPAVVSPYLTAGGRNPTPYQFLARSLSPPRQIDEAAEILRRRRVPYVVAAPIFLKPDDPIALLLAERYELVNMPELFLSGNLPEIWLYARVDGAGSAP